MPILAVLMLLLEIGCAIHAGKTGRPQFWLYIIIALPGVGVLAYVLIELLPEYLGSYEGQRATQAVGRVVNPGRRYRALASEAEAAPTVENMLRLAEECVALARYDEAIGLFEHCLQGMHANDPKILLGLAEAQFGKGDAADAVATLDRLRAANPDYRSPEGHLLYARALEAAGELSQAREEYEALVEYYPGPEARCRYALLLHKMGDAGGAAAVFGEIRKQLDRAPRHIRRRYREWHAMARSNATN